MGNKNIEYGEVTNSLGLDRTIQPASHFAQGFTLTKEWERHEDFQFHVSKSYAVWEDGIKKSEYDGKWYLYGEAVVPSSTYISLLLDNLAGLYSCEMDPKSKSGFGVLKGSRVYEQENDFFVSADRLNANQKFVTGYDMKPEMELEFIANYKAINDISDSDYSYMPTYFIESINGLFSRNLQRLEWAKTTNDSNIKGRQLNQFIADFIFCWNNPLIQYNLSLDAKVIPTRATSTTNTSVASDIQF